MISLIDGRELGSLCSIAFTRDVSSAERLAGGGANWPRMMRIARAGSESASKGLRRVQSSYSSTPSAHTSAFSPYGSPLMTSGAR